MDIPLPKSFSNIGRTADASHKRTKKIHLHKSKFHLKPWDGLDLVEQILTEARGTCEGKPREMLVLSSPRTNPVLEEKAVAETSASAFEAFIRSTASGIAQQLPAAAPESRELSSESEPDNESGFAKQKRIQHHSVRASPCFLSGERPSLADGTRAPSVGKYNPKYSIVERHAPNVVIPRTSKRKSVLRSQTATLSGHTEHLPTSADDVVAVKSSLANTQRPLSPASHSSKSPRVVDALKVYRKHDVRDCSSAFRSQTPRSTTPSGLDLLYWPLPHNGSTTYSPGAIHGNARERAFTPFGSPQGARVDYDTSALDHLRRPASVDLQRAPSREAHKIRIMFPTVDTTLLAYEPKDTVLSTKHSQKAAYSMKKQLSRPPPRPATPGDPLDPYHNSMLTSPKRGFVDIKRMISAPPLYADDEIAAPQVLNPHREVVEYRSPSTVFEKAPRNAGSVASGHVVDVSYNVSDASVRRHRPVCAMPRSDRKTFEVKPTCLRDEAYNVNDRSHVAAVEFGKQISRDRRDKRFEFK